MAARFPHPAQPIDPIEVQINHFFNCIINCVNARRTTLLEMAVEKRNAKKDRLTRRKEGEKQLIKTRGEIERSMKENILQEVQERMLLELDQKLEELRTPFPQTRVVFRGEYGQLEQLIAALGEIREEEVTAVPKYETMIPIVAVGKKGRALGELWSPNAVAIDSNTNHIYVTEGHPFVNFPRISIFSDKGEFVDSYTHKHMRRPEGIVIHKENMYVTDTKRHAVFQFKIESNIRLVTKLGTRGNGNGEFDTPTNLAVSTNGDVYVSDTNNNRVQILDGSLHYIRTLTEQPIEEARDIKLTADSVYVLCGVSPCIRVFSYTGDMIRSLITRGYQLQVDNPLYFCLDAQTNIIISDNNAHSIVAFTKEGTLIYSIDGGDEIINPRGLALNKELKLVIVSDNVNYCLHIFFSL